MCGVSVVLFYVDGSRNVQPQSVHENGRFARDVQNWITGYLYHSVNTTILYGLAIVFSLFVRVINMQLFICVLGMPALIPKTTTSRRSSQRET